jgi:murein L,D-transpeptidase YafK
MAHHPGTTPAKMTCQHPFIIIGIVVLFCVGAGISRAALDSPLEQDAGLSISREPETSLLNALENLNEQQLDQAQGLLEQLVRQTPDFRLAHLVYADILAAKAGQLTGLGAGMIPESELAGLEDEARRRWRHHLQQPPKELTPVHLLRIGEDQPYALMVDLELSRMYVFANISGLPRLVDHYYITGGKHGPVKQREGDQRTPVGVYFIQGHIPGRNLPDYYGWGAFPLNYPNAWDRRQGKTGSGIWLHGNPVGMFSRPPQASDGCVTIHNQDLEVLGPLLQTGRIPVIISRNVKWADPEVQRQLDAEMVSRLETWRRDWESRNTKAYLKHYSRDFRSDDQDFAAWAKHKTRVNAVKKEIRVRLNNLSLLLYPEDPDLIVAVFDQDYWSDNFQSKSGKHQYWRKEQDGQWRIIYEGIH